MERWQAEMDEKRLGVVDAKDEHEAKILVSKADPERNE